MRKGKGFGSIVAAVKATIAQLIGIEVGDLVALEDVGGSPGLPAVDGSQLTGISTGQTSYTFGNPTLDTNLLPYVRGYWRMSGGEPNEPNIAPQGTKMRFGKSANATSTDVSGDGYGITITDGQFMIAPSYPVFPLGEKAPFLVRFLLKTGTLSQGNNILWVSPLGADYTLGLGIDSVHPGGILRVVQNATNRIAVGGVLADNTLHDVCLMRLIVSGTAWFYLYVNGAYAGAFSTGADVFTVEDAPLFLLGRRTDSAAWAGMSISHLMVADSMTNTLISGIPAALWNSGSPRVMVEA